jgi:hypothetical protein
MGVAAIIAAIAPMVVASIQAKADVKIAEINAATQIKLTNITADTSKYLADQQKDIALTQSNIAQQISTKNNESVTQRLQMQLNELSAARTDAEKAEEEKRQLDYQYNQERIQLAQKQASDNLALAKQTLNAQLTQAGLSQGFSNSVNSGDRLGVSRNGLAGGGGGSLAGAGNRDYLEGTPLATNSRPRDFISEMNDALASQGPTRLLASAQVVDTSAARKGSADLLKSVGAGVDEEGEEGDPKAPSKAGRKRAKILNGGGTRRQSVVRNGVVIVGRNADAVASVLSHSLAAGSTVGRLNKATPPKPKPAPVPSGFAQEATPDKPTPLSGHRTQPSL